MLSADCCPERPSCIQNIRMARLEKIKRWQLRQTNIVNVINHKIGSMHGFRTLESRFESIGVTICKKINNKQISLEKALNDIIDFSRDRGLRRNEIRMAWSSLHLALGLCFQYNVKNKETLRRFLREILLYSRGIDLGLFMRDILFYDSLSPTDYDQAKSFYYLSFVAGFKVNLEEDSLGDKIFVGPAIILYRHLLKTKMCSYIEFPIGDPTLTMSNKSTLISNVSSTPLGLACERLKPSAVLLLVRYGASPIGKPIDHILSVLGSQKIVEEATRLIIGDTPLEHAKKCLEYCLRAVRGIKIRIGEEIVGGVIKDNDKEHKHFIKDRVVEFLPDDCYKTPPKLKHLARCEIRNIMFTVDSMPYGIKKLQKLNNDCKRYLDLLT